MGCSLPGSSLHGMIPQTRVLERIAIASSRESSQPRDWTCISCGSCIGRQILCHQVTWEAVTTGYLWTVSLVLLYATMPFQRLYTHQYRKSITHSNSKPFSIRVKGKRIFNIVNQEVPRVSDLCENISKCSREAIFFPSRVRMPPKPAFRVLHGKRQFKKKKNWSANEKCADQK